MTHERSVKKQLQSPNTDGLRHKCIFQEGRTVKAKPMVMLLTMLAGWMKRQQQEIIEYLKAENNILGDELQKATGKLLSGVRKCASAH